MRRNVACYAKQLGDDSPGTAAAYCAWQTLHNEPLVFSLSREANEVFVKVSYQTSKGCDGTTRPDITGMILAYTLLQYKPSLASM